MKILYPVAAAIADFRRTYSPYTEAPEDQQQIRLRFLADEIAEANGTFWTLDLRPSIYYVYVYLDPRQPGRWEYTLPSGRVVRFPYRPFYVGKGKGGRYLQHLVSRNNSHKVLTINNIRAAGFDPKDYVFLSRRVQGSSEALALAYEADLIAGIGRADCNKGPLTNHTDGGEGGAGSVQTLEDRARKSASHLKRWKQLGMGLCITHDGRTHTIPEWSRLLGIPDITLYGRWRDGHRSPEKLLHVGNLRKLPRGKTLTHEGTTLTFKQWSEHLGLARHVICARYKKG